MPKVKVEIPKAEYDLIRGVAWKLGLPVETLIQQEIDAAITTISVWTQRVERTKTMETIEHPKSEHLNCPDCKAPLEIKKNQLACTNGHCDVIAVRASGKIIRATTM